MPKERSMQRISNIDWFEILQKEATTLERELSIRIDIDERISLEVGRLINDHLQAIGLAHPNVAKVAGQVAFWIRKLKPLQLSKDSPNSLLTLNEMAALRIGLFICNTFKDDSSKDKKIALPPRIFRDWINSFRYHSHSPHSSMISFELLMCDA